jgi:uncharacterized membrane protein
VNNYVVIVLRLVHIISGIFWVGSGLAFFFFIGPTLGATAEAGQKFAQHLMIKTRFTAILTSSAILTVLAGAVLYWRDSDGLSSNWMHTAQGLGFGVGAFFALIGLVFGTMVGSTNGALAKLGSQIQGKPTPDQMAQIGALRKRLSLVSPINAYSLIIAAIFMAIARYLH